MGRNRRAKQRIDAGAEKTLESEKRRNEQKIHEALPDSALFEQQGGKKKKILLHPRPAVEPIPTTTDIQYTDLWGAAPTSKPTKRKTPRTFDPPTSDDSYRSAKHLKKANVEEVEETSAVADPTSIVVVTEIGEDGIGDTMEGDVSTMEQVDVPAPAPKVRQRSDVVFTARIPRWLPDEQKKALRKQLKDGHRELRARKERALLPEFENVVEIAEEVRTKVKEEMEKPKKEKEDGLMRFIADEPGFENETVPTKLSELSADLHPLSRVQRTYEMKRKVGLHE